MQIDFYYYMLIIFEGRLVLIPLGSMHYFWKRARFLTLYYI